MVGFVMFCVLSAFGKTANLNGGVMVSMQIIIGILLYPVLLILFKDEFVLVFMKKLTKKICRGKE